MAILSITLFLDRWTRESLRREALAEVAAVADLKADQVERWRRERLAEGLSVGRSSFFGRAFAAWVERGAPDDEERGHLLERIAAIRGGGGYREVRLLDTSGAARLAAGGSLQLSDEVRSAVESARGSRKPELTEVHRGNAGEIEIDLVVPLVEASGGPRLLGFYVCEWDPGTYLFPLLERWPGASGSAESLLVRREGDDVVFLSAMRHRKGAAPGLRLQARPDLPAARALAGVGAGEAVDYRGVEVLAAWRPVPGTDWGIVAKVDAAEVFGRLHPWSHVTTGGVALLVLAAVAISALWWRQHRLWLQVRERDAELEKRAVAAHFGSLWQLAMDVILLLDEDLRIVEVNQRVRDVYGYEPEELRGEPLARLSPAETAGEAREGPRLRDGTTTDRFESIHARKDGTTFPVEISSSVLTLEGKAFRQSIIRDVSERRAAEEALRTSEQKLRQLFDGMLEGFALHDVVLDAEGRPVDYVFLEVNPAWERATGLKAAAAVGRRITEVLPGIERSWIDRFGSVAVTGEAVHFVQESPLLGKTFDCTVFRPSPGRFAVIFADVTERRRAEEALRESEERFRATFEHAAVGIALVSTDGRFLQVNPKLREILGRNEDELLGATSRELTFGADVESSGRGYQSLLENQRSSFGIEKRYVRKDGSIVWANVMVAPLRAADGSVESFVSVVEDITARKLAEEKAGRMTRLYGALSATNKAIVHSPSRAELFSRVCAAAAAAGGFPAAWIAEPGPGGRLSFLAVAGQDPLVAAELSLSFEPQGLPSNDPASRALATGALALENDLEESLRTGLAPAPWAEAVRRSGLAAAAAVPLHEEGRVVAALVVFARQKDYFDPTLLELLEEMGSDVSFALGNFERERRRLLWGNLFEAAREAIVVTDAQASILHVNAAFEEITGYSAAEVVGRNPRLLQSGRHERDFYAAMWAELLATGRWRGEIWNRRKSGDVYPALLSLTAVREAGTVRNFIGISTDVTDQKAADEEVEFLSHHDALTGLPNRSLFEALLEQGMAAARRLKRQVAVLCLDVDLFKTFNESFGHQEGDALLRELAARLGAVLRGEDVLCRPGGDEFLVLIPSVTDPADVRRVAQKLLDVAAQPFETGGRHVTLTASLGIALHPGDAADSQALLRAAETAMYHAKEAGRNNFQFFAREMNRQAVEALEMETRLLRAILGHELFLEYQPQVEILTGRVAVAEALVRWRDPERGVVPPEVFIRLAEERGLVGPIGEWVLRAACQEAVRWRRQGRPPVRVAVNISALQFRLPAFEERLKAVLEETGAEPGDLELELTESILMKDADAIIGLLERLRALGLHFAIDDFGTGWSSLSYLRRFPIDRLKIDRSFVRDLGADPGANSIVQAVISLARNLKLGVVAEGVETSRQLAFLRFHGCDEVQGFLLCRPCPADEMWARIEDGRLRR